MLITFVEDDKNIEIQEDFMDKIDANEAKSSMGSGGGPDDEDPEQKKKEKRSSDIKMTTTASDEKVENENMIVD